MPQSICYSGQYDDIITPEEKAYLLDRLRLVGENKPLGYLPIETLMLCGYTPEMMIFELMNGGAEIATLQLSESESGVGSGALYAYHKTALERVLVSGEQILRKNGWPTKPEEFVRHLKVIATDYDLYYLIMVAFNDDRLRSE